jgi:hypothetical protein
LTNTGLASKGNETCQERDTLDDGGDYIYDLGAPSLRQPTENVGRSQSQTEAAGGNQRGAPDLEESFDGFASSGGVISEDDESYLSVGKNSVWSTQEALTPTQHQPAPVRKSRRDSLELDDLDGVVVANTTTVGNATARRGSMSLDDL